jgi:hypothetical protein
MIIIIIIEINQPDTRRFWRKLSIQELSLTQQCRAGEDTQLSYREQNLMRPFSIPWAKHLESARLFSGLKPISLSGVALYFWRSSIFHPFGVLRSGNSQYRRQKSITPGHFPSETRGQLAPASNFWAFKH